MTSPATILHLDMDAFFAAVEQRDKPSLAGKPVVVGGIGTRGVVSTASYEARTLGVHSAMATAIARRMAPRAAYLAGRFEAYRQSSRIVMDVLRELSPVIEPLSLDEAYLDLTGTDLAFPCPDMAERLEEVRQRVRERTEGLTCSVGVGTNKLMAKCASEKAKPNGLYIVQPGSERDFITQQRLRDLPGIGPATAERLTRLGVTTVSQLQQMPLAELVRELGKAHGHAVAEMAMGRDDRVVEWQREVKSISMEDTFAYDLTERAEIQAICERQARLVVARLRKRGLFARTVTLKVRMADFTTLTRSRTLEGATDHEGRIAAIAQGLLAELDVRGGVRLLGVGVANFAGAAQEELFTDDLLEPAAGSAEDSTDDREAPVSLDGVLTTNDGEPANAVETALWLPSGMKRGAHRWPPGADVMHAEHGRGWVWGANDAVVTVRFEYRGSPVGRVRSFSVDDPDLHRAAPLDMEWDRAEDET